MQSLLVGVVITSVGEDRQNSSGSPAAVKSVPLCWLNSYISTCNSFGCFINTSQSWGWEKQQCSTVQVSLWTKLFALSLFKENIPAVGCSVAVKKELSVWTEMVLWLLTFSQFGLTEQLQADFEPPAKISGKSKFTLVFTCFNDFLPYENKWSHCLMLLVSLILLQD